MSKIRTLILAAALTPVVLAGTAKLASAQTIGIGLGQSQSSSGASAGASAVSNNGITFNSPAYVQTKQKGRVATTANGFAPALAASAVNTCLGSWSAGVGITGLGLSGGSTYLEKHCEARMTGTLLAQMGAKNAGLLALCANPIAYDALAASGVRCPFGSGNHYAAASTQPAAVAAPAPITMTRRQYEAYQRAQAAQAAPVVQAAVVQQANPGQSRAEIERAGALGAKTNLYNQCVAQGGQACATFR